MNIKLSKSFTSNGKVDEFDTRQMKKALNRLGYYQPYEKVGMTGIPEQGWPGSRKYDPFRPDRDENPDPYFDKKPPQSPYMPIYEDLPWLSEGEDI